MVLKETKYNIDRFTELYEKNRFLARVYALEKQPHIDYTVLNESSEKKFQVFYTTHNYGVSKTLKRYIRKRDTKKIFVNDNRFFVDERRKLFPLCVGSLNTELRKIFIERFSWIKFLIECDLTTVPFNTIVRHKLYSRDKVLKHIYKCPADKALYLKQQMYSAYDWKKISENSFNAENLNAELLCSSYLSDACSLAFKLNEKVNLAWSTRRLKEEHDKWSQAFTKYVIEMDNEPLKNRQVFIDFNEFLGGGLLTQSGELANEGYTQRHCVATYKNQINYGHCAIFHIKGYTAELRYKGNDNGLYVNQFKGNRNCDAPIELRNELLGKVKLFNEKVLGKTYETQECVHEELDEYPF
jgi:hypothetical protein